MKKPLYARSYNLSEPQHDILRIVRGASIDTNINHNYLVDVMARLGYAPEQVEYAARDLVARNLLAYRNNEYDLAD